jgi:type I restriction enzyme S subunit
LELPLPPLPEQRRIVARIEELFSRLDAGVAALRHAKAQLQRYRQSVLAAAVTGQLTQAWREQHPDTEPASETVAAMLRAREENWARKGKYLPAEKPPADLNPLPERWCWATWDQLSHWVTYGFTRPMEHVGDGVPIVTAKHVKWSRINYEEGHRTPQDAYDDLSEKDRPKPGDILVTKDGTIGRAAVVESDRPFCINQSVAVVWLRTCPMYRKYLLTTIETESAQHLMTGKARGVAIKHLSITDFARMSVPIPPLAEQHQIVAEVEARTTAIDHLEAELDCQITRSNRLRQSILAKAFAGQL